ncbi:type I-A CRISPR-associated protein Csa5 [Metallosphaera cuprina]|nr:type I-A CRISPR-associated protein Csa5 [Metallosphaera cuprina]
MSSNLEFTIKKVANLLAAVSIYAESPTFLDRISNALSKEAVVKVIGESERILNVGLNNKEINKLPGEKPQISIKVSKDGEKTVIIYGDLPTPYDVEQFIHDVENNIYLARKAGALAMATVNNALVRVGQ